MKKVLINFLLLAAVLFVPVAAVAGLVIGITVKQEHAALAVVPLGGMIINQASLAAIYNSFNTLFNQAFSNVTPLWNRVAMRVPSVGRQNTYAWLGHFPRLREWIGDRVIKSLAAHSYTIVNKPFESTVEVDRDDVDDDMIGLYNPIVSEMGRATAVHPDELIFELLAAGFNTPCYDGQYFFDTDHPVGSGTVSNFGGGAGSAWYLLDVSRAIKPLIYQPRKPPQFVSFQDPKDESVFMRKKFIYGVDLRGNAGFGLWQMAYASKDTLNATNYAAARVAMMSLKDEEGKPLGIKPGLLVVHPGNEEAAREILMNERDASGATNKWRGTAELLMVPWLT